MVTVSEAIREQWGDVELTPDCEEDCEGWFSWSRCDGCGSTLGGERHRAAAHTKGHAPFNQKYDYMGIAICVDCLSWLANGQDFDFETRDPLNP